MKTLTITLPEDVYAQAVAAVCDEYGYVAQPGDKKAKTADQFFQWQVWLWLRKCIVDHSCRQGNAGVIAAAQKVAQAALDKTTADMDKAAEQVAMSVK